MQLISEEYRLLNEYLHKQYGDYGGGGQRHFHEVKALAESIGTTDILDYGCGKSTLSMQFSHAINQYDPAIPRFSALPEPADFVVCTDVLEHIEPELIGEVMQHLQGLTKKAIFAVIATGVSLKNLPDGRNAHLLVETPRWWLNCFFDYFDVVSYTRLANGVKIMAQPKEKKKPCAS
jgi:hypothetical protein